MQLSQALREYLSYQILYSYGENDIATLQQYLDRKDCYWESLTPQERDLANEIMRIIDECIDE